jgi:4-hydroxy-2-oxoheptanedioate aldolase
MGGIMCAAVEQAPAPNVRVTTRTGEPKMPASPSDPRIARTRIRERVRAGEVTFGAFAALGSPLAAELLGRAGFDWLILDLEHGAGAEADLLALLYAVETTPAAALVRVQEGTRLRVGRALDLGAEGLMIPRLETTDEVRRTAGWLRWPPEGGRGLAAITRGAGLGEVPHAEIARLNERTLGIFQVESPLAVANAAEIAAIEGVDVLFVGPADLSHGMGIPGRFDDPAFIGALTSVASAARAAGKAAGILLRTADEIRPHLDLGYTFLGIGSDQSFIIGGARAVLAASREA